MIDNLEGVEETAVIGVPHPDFGEAVVAVIVCSATTNIALDEETIIQGLAECLAKYKQPKKLFIVESFPRNAMGKVQKNLLREQYSKAALS